MESEENQSNLSGLLVFFGFIVFAAWLCTRRNAGAELGFLIVFLSLTAFFILINPIGEQARLNFYAQNGGILGCFDRVIKSFNAFAIVLTIFLYTSYPGDDAWRLGGNVNVYIYSLIAVIGGAIAAAFKVYSCSHDRTKEGFAEAHQASQEFLKSQKFYVRRRPVLNALYYALPLITLALPAYFTFHALDGKFQYYIAGYIALNAAIPLFLEGASKSVDQSERWFGFGYKLAGWAALIALLFVKPPCHEFPLGFDASDFKNPEEIRRICD